MRILFDGVPLAGRVTGVGHYGRQLARALATHPDVEQVGICHGWRVERADTWLASASRNSSRRRDERWAQRLRPALAWGRHVAQGWRSLLFSRQTRRGNWDLFHEPNYIAPRAHCPVATTIHDLAFLRFPEFLPKDRLQFLRASIDRSLERSAVILADSRFTRDELIDLCPRVDAARIHVAHLGVDKEEFHPRQSQEDSQALSHFGLPSRFVLYLGTLEPRKNLQGLLAAYEQLPESLQREYPLVLAGMRGWNRSFFQAALDRLGARGRIREVGYVAQHEVAPLLRAANALVFPSLYEGFGLPPLEAMACGTPVVASSAASLPEVLGNAALLADPREPAAIAEGLTRVLCDSSFAAQLVERGVSQASRFTWKRCADETVAAYRTVVRSDRTRRERRQAA